MKYLLILLLMSGYVSADIENEIRLQQEVIDLNEYVYQVEKQNNELMQIALQQAEQISKWRGYAEMVADDCIKGLGFAGMGSDGVMYRLNCSFNKAVK